MFHLFIPSKRVFTPVHVNNFNTSTQVEVDQILGTSNIASKLLWMICDCMWVCQNANIYVQSTHIIKPRMSVPRDLPTLVNPILCIMSHITKQLSANKINAFFPIKTVSKASFFSGFVMFSESKLKFQNQWNPRYLQDIVSFTTPSKHLECSFPVPSVLHLHFCLFHSFSLGTGVWFRGCGHVLLSVRVSVMMARDAADHVPIVDFVPSKMYWFLAQTVQQSPIQNPASCSWQSKSKIHIPCSQVNTCSSYCL